jgi:hypothetical protein
VDKQKENPASAKEQADASKKNIEAGANSDADEFQRKTGLEGKTDSGPEPEVHGRDIPPQGR